MKIITVSLGCLLALSVLAGCQNKKPPKPIASPAPSSLNPVYYDYDQALIRNDQAQVLMGNAAVLRGRPNWTITIEGHCDERGTNEYNLALGDRRARSSRDYLINLGIDPNRLRTVSFGEERPVCYDHNENCWSRNRRAQFVR